MINIVWHLIYINNSQFITGQDEGSLNLMWKFAGIAGQSDEISNILLALNDCLTDTQLYPMLLWAMEKKLCKCDLNLLL
jgi:hypothetical protein